MTDDPGDRYFGTTKAEAAFRNIIVRLIVRGVYPSPTAINRARLGTHFGQENSINGRECRWRESEFQKHGYRYVNPAASGRKRSWWHVSERP